VTPHVTTSAASPDSTNTTAIDMAAPTHNANAVSADTLITIKVSVNESLKKLKLPLKDLGANVLPDKVRAATQGHRRLECLSA
jgi:hypothetical protein